MRMRKLSAHAEPSADGEIPDAPQGMNQPEGTVTIDSLGCVSRPRNRYQHRERSKDGRRDQGVIQQTKRTIAGSKALSASPFPSKMESSDSADELGIQYAPRFLSRDSPGRFWAREPIVDPQRPTDLPRPSWAYTNFLPSRRKSRSPPSAPGLNTYVNGTLSTEPVVGMAPTPQYSVGSITPTVSRLSGPLPV